MGWGNKRWGLFVWVLAVACGLATSSGIATAHAADDGNTKSTEGQGGVRFGIDREEYDAQARAAMQVDPVVAEHLGAIRKIALDDAASMDEPGPDVLVFDVEGSRGKGRVTARFITVSATEEALGPGVLVMADGTEHAIEGDAEALAGEDGAHDHDHDHEEDIEAGAGAFVRQAQEAAQRYPLIRQHIGEISTFEIDTDATGAAPGMNTFVFDLAGDKGRGRLEADFITVSADTERLGKGVLTLANGRKLSFDGEPPGEDELAEGIDAGDMLAGDNIFTRQARVAVQRFPLVQQHIGTLSAFDMDLMATGEAEGGNEFVFALVGDKGRGRILAEFITVDADTERLGKGVLTLADGREIAFEGEPPTEAELAAARPDAVPDTFARQDGIFVLQANAAMQADPVVQRYIGDIREAIFDRDASWAADGDRYMFDLKGSKGQGRLEAEFITVDEDSERLGEGELIMADGKRHPLGGK